MGLLLRELELLKYAVRRYPDMEPRMALACFGTDRYFAGLGALEESKRRRCGTGPRRHKRIDHFSPDPTVLYTMQRFEDPREEIVDEPLPPVDPFDATRSYETLTFQTRVVPAVNFCLCFKTTLGHHQRERDLLAGELRRMRRQYRASLPP